MKDKGVILESIRSVRWNLYLIFLANTVFIQFFAPFQYACDFTEERCITCGLRTAVSLFLQGRFAEAYQSNKLIVVIVIAGLIMAADVLHSLYQRCREKRSVHP